MVIYDRLLDRDTFYPFPGYHVILVGIIVTGKQQVESLLQKLPDNCSLEDVQYHLYVMDKVNRGLDDARKNGAISQEEAEKRLSQWLTE